MSHFQEMRQQRIKAVYRMAKDVLKTRVVLPIPEEEELVFTVSSIFGVRVKLAREYVRIVLTQIKFEATAPNDVKKLLAHSRKPTQPKKEDK